MPLQPKSNPRNQKHELPRWNSKRSTKCSYTPGYNPNLPGLTILYSWDKKYKAVESLAPADEVNELDHYVFVVRRRLGTALLSKTTSVSDCSVDKETKKQIQYVDVKSAGLRDILRKVLQDVQGICLHKEKPSVNLKPIQALK